MATVSCALLVSYLFVHEILTLDLAMRIIKGLWVYPKVGNEDSQLLSITKITLRLLNSWNTSNNSTINPREWKNKQIKTKAKPIFHHNNYIKTIKVKEKGLQYV